MHRIRCLVAVAIALTLVFILQCPLYTETDSSTSAGNYVLESTSSYIYYCGCYYQKYGESYSLAIYASSMDGNIIIVDKRNGFKWCSRVDDFMVKDEEEKGLGSQWLNNIKSPFIIEYIAYNEDLPSASYNHVFGNFTDMDTVCIIDRINDGFRINYYLTKINSSFSYEVRLKDDHVDVKIPFDSIKEGVTEKILNIRMFPFLGHVKNDTPDSYFFVPDGPGGIITVKKNIKYSAGYTTKIYGRDRALLAHLQNSYEDESLMPVYGIKNKDNAVTAIIKKGEFYTDILCMPAGVFTQGIYWACPQFSHRVEYMRNVNLGGQAVKRFTLITSSMRVSEQPIAMDKEVRYCFTYGATASYTGMAAEYRKYLQETLGLEKLDLEGDIPLKLYIFCGATKKSFIGREFVTATTFRDASRIVEKLYFSGIKECSVTLWGWMKHGADNNLVNRFPAERKLGGDKELKNLVNTIHLFNYKVNLFDEYLYVENPGVFFKPKKNAIYDIMNRVLNWTNPGLIVKFRLYGLNSSYLKSLIEKNMNKYKDYGIDGLSLTGIGSLLTTDFNPRQFKYRDVVAADYREIINYARENLGETAVLYGPAYLLGSIDRIEYTKTDYSFSQFIDEVVPFYQIVLHGIVEFYSRPINFFDDRKVEFLKCLEYGIIPSFLVTMENSSVLSETRFNDIYSSQFSEWEDMIHDYYKKSSTLLSRVRNLHIIGHEKVDTDVYRVKYEGRLEVIFNYRDTAYRYDKVDIPPLDYIILENGVVL